MGPTSNKERIRNVDEVDPRKEVIKFNVDTKDKNTVNKISYVDIFIHVNKRHNEVGTESSCGHQYKNDNVRPNLCSSCDDVSMWSHHKTSDKLYSVTIQVHTSS